MGDDATGEARRRVEELGRRYVDLVYGAAVRQMGGEGRGAEDVTQVVFLVAMRKAKAGGLPEEGRMAGWLLKVTGYAVREARRGERVRRRHEQGAGRERVGGEEGVGPGIAIPGLLEVDVAEVRRALDQALLKLGAVDREIVVRRYLRGEAVGDVAIAVGMTENTASQRIGRALEKLRRVMGRRGVVVPVAGVVGVMVAEGAKGVPAGLGVSVAAGAGVIGGSSAAAVSIAKGAAVMAKATTAKMAAAVICIFLVLGLGTAVIIKWATGANETPIATNATGGAALAAPATAPATGVTTQASLEVESVVEKHSDQLLKEVLAGIEESRRKLITLYVVGQSTSEVFDFSTNEWKTGMVNGRIWMEAGPKRRTRVEVDLELEQKGNEETSYVEAWDGIATRLLYGKPLSQERGIIYRSRQLKAQRVGGTDYSFQLAWDEETSADAGGSHKTVDRDPLNPDVLAGMKLEARRVKLRGRPATETIAELAVRFPDTTMERTETFWFDMAGGGSRKGYALVGRVDSISLQGREMRRIERIITRADEAAPGVFYPTEATMVWTERGKPIMREHYLAKTVAANDAALIGNYNLVFPDAVGVVEMVNGREVPTTQR